MKPEGLKTVIVEYPEMTVRQLAAITAMNGRPNIKSRELAAYLKVHRSALTRIWDTLVKYGLIQRRRSDIDGRDVYGNLTERGVEFCKQLVES